MFSLFFIFEVDCKIQNLFLIKAFYFGATLSDGEVLFTYEKSIYSYKDKFHLINFG